MKKHRIPRHMKLSMDQCLISDPGNPRSGRRTILYVLLIAASIPLSACDECTKVSSCACDCDIGSIDLAEIAVEAGPMFKDFPDPLGEYHYSYSPCHPFTETSTGGFENHCNDVAACQVIGTGSAFQYYDIGTQDTVTFHTENGDSVGLETDDEVIVAIYTAKDQSGATSRQSEVIMQCTDEATNLVVIGELDQPGIPTYRFLLVSPACCMETGGIGIGTIMVITFLSLLAAYVIIGVIYNKLGRGATGKELVPNYTFWSAIPGLIRDGSCFICRRGRTAGYTDIK